MNFCLQFAELGVAFEGVEYFRRKFIRKPLLVEPFEALEVFDMMMVSGLAEERSLSVDG